MIEGLELFGYHGATQEERERGQLFSLDLELELDLPNGDDLAHTADYVRVIEMARQVNAENSFRLLESFARAVAERVLQDLSLVQRVRVRVWKERPPLPPGMQIRRVAAEAVCSRGR
ncbi:MAG: dihydroneopterin aldolase [Candidatus Bipolaricaulota bacterium]|nr:dihydroneopterin aldolase [Candidatus Bipolaricaulota bacterium]MCS7274179.1 dihydroneopterin aldolase [Candidatus Bipolaricaulota bacterium]MDW8110085.1 dihydroneopterin aldolase [Candidatus Bipolaricaulota bacterium]MDW8328995.1 dihydroneopterin aldolase [Candidatus Bipolaricaulota bacterium]